MEPVRFRDCSCPGTPHAEGDTVTFHPRLSFDQNVKALRLILSSEGGVNASAAWPVYLFDGPASWNLIDEDGKAVPLNHAALEALPWVDQYEIADNGDTLYGETVLAPLVQRMRKSSPTSLTTERSRRRTSSSATPPARRKR